MNVVEYPIKHPGLCFLCEQTPLDCAWLDLNRDFETGVLTRLTGRKYVCGHCVSDVAQALGWTDPNRLWELETILENTNADLQHYRSELEKTQKSMTKDFFDVLDKLGYIKQEKAKLSTAPRKTKDPQEVKV